MYCCDSDSHLYCLQWMCLIILASSHSARPNAMVYHYCCVHQRVATEYSSHECVATPELTVLMKVSATTLWRMDSSALFLYFLLVQFTLVSKQTFDYSANVERRVMFLQLIITRDDSSPSHNDIYRWVWNYPFRQTAVQSMMTHNRAHKYPCSRFVTQLHKQFEEGTFITNREQVYNDA